MKFKTHVVGGSMAGIVVVTAGQVSGYTSVDLNQLTGIVNDPQVIQGDITKLVGLFMITIFMSLFPDLDSASILQRWFYRVLLLVLVVLFLTGQMGVFAAVSFVGLLPLLHKHRGWTHSKFTPILLSIFFAVIIELHRSNQAWFGEFSLANVGSILKEYWIYTLACVLGHYTHLLLDWKL